MNAIKVLFALSLLANVYMAYQMYSIEINNGSIVFQKNFRNTTSLGIIHKEECPTELTANRICSVEIVEKRTDFMMLKVHYHYIKGEEGSNRIVVKANKGSHDNIVGTKGLHFLKEGSHTVFIPFGLYRADNHQKENPYISEYIVVRAKGVSEDTKRYVIPHIFETYIKYKKSWYAELDDISW